ncbi:hypothetical protein DF268_45405 [Streptomyces sp. V2]|nr:hypothetical protein DF268_45405 [Streptomyces sp. V2]
MSWGSASARSTGATTRTPRGLYAAGLMVCAVLFLYGTGTANALTLAGAASALAPPSPVTATAHPVPDRAGSRPGEGRERPGRPSTPDPTPEENTAPAPRPVTPPPSPPLTTPIPLEPTRQTLRRADPHTSTLRILPLGTGLVLLGLGLALAWTGLRLRRR